MADVVTRAGPLVRNTLLNLLGQVIPLAVGIVTLPYTIHGMGADRFGILSLAWVLVGYFSLFDLGLGRATTKFVAEARGRGQDDRIARVVWTSLAAQTGLGMVAGLVLAAGTPLLSSRVLKTPPSLLPETRDVLYALSVSIPVITCARNLRGVLEAVQRFDLINAIRIPVGVLTFLVPMVGARLHYPVSHVVVALVVVIAASAVAYLIYCLRVLPGVFRTPSVDNAMVRPLLVFGGWVTVSNVIVPVLVYLDRFLIGVLLPVEALAYYSAPYEVAARLLIVPAALSTTLFPAFSALSALDWGDLRRLYIRSLKYILVGLGPLALCGAIFGQDLMRVWLGTEFAAKSSVVFQILSIGMLLNSLSQMPANLFDSVGRPDLRAKVFLSYVFLYAGLLWFLISRLGIMGAALAWSARGALECLLFLLISQRLLRVDREILVEHRLAPALAAYLVLAVATWASVSLFSNFVLRGAMITVCMILFAVYAWTRVLDDRERGAFSLAGIAPGERKSLGRLA